MDFTKYDENAIKYFQCEQCYKSKDIIIWKSLSSHLNDSYKNKYMCNDCWNQIDDDLENHIKERIKSLRVQI